MTSDDESAAAARSSADVVREGDFTHSVYTVEGDLERLGAAALIARRGGRSPIVRAFAIAAVVATGLSVLGVIVAMLATVIS